MGSGHGAAPSPALPCEAVLPVLVQRIVHPAQRASCNYTTPGGSLWLWRPRSFRCLGQGRWVVRQTIEVGNDVGALGRARHAGKCHVRPGDRSSRVGNELIDVVDGPVAALGLERGGVIEPPFRGFRTPDDAPQVRSYQRPPALVEGVASRAFLSGVLATAGISAGKKLLDRLLWLLLLGLSPRFLLRHHDLIPRFGRLRGRKNCPRRDIN